VRVLGPIRYRLLQRRLAARRLLRAFADAYPEARFVEIGANDGVQHDHLRPFILDRRWSGVMVEPQPHVFARLALNYAGVTGVAIENAAITDRDGRVAFYYPAPPSDERDEAGLPDWYDGIGSLSREAVLSHARHIPDIEQRLVETEVPSLSYASLCEKHGLARVDLLLLDTEGADYELLRGMDFGERPPRLVIYEHYHLTASERVACREYMESLGFETMEEGFDTFCLDTGPDDALTRTWRDLHPAVAGIASYEEREG
jgi:FkbM family methyltransferase